MKKQTLKVRYVSQEEYDALKAAHDDLNAQFLDLTKRTHKVKDIIATLSMRLQCGQVQSVMDDLREVYAVLM